MAVIPPQHWLPYGEHMQRLFLWKDSQGMDGVGIPGDGGTRRFMLY